MKRYFLLLLALCWAGAGRANCAASPGSLGYGSATSYDLRAGSVAQATGSAGLLCSGSFLQLLGGNSAKATVTSANNFRLSAGGTDVIPFQLSADAGGTQVFTQGGTIDYFSPTLVSLLGIGGSGSFNAPLFGRLTAAPNVAAGTYRDTVTVNWNWSVCDGVQVTTSVCAPAYSTGHATVTITITLVVGNDCRIAAPDVTFGTAAFAKDLSPVNGAVLVSCTKGATYQVAFSNGQSGTARPWRTMTDGNGHGLQYNLFRTDGATIWDQSNPQPGSAPGTGDTSPTQAQAFVARVNPDQVTPPAGRYADQVSVVLSF